MIKHKVTNTSSSHITINGSNLAPAASIQVDVVNLQLRAFEERGFLKIEPVSSEPVKRVPSSVSEPATPKVASAPMAIKPEPKYKGYRRDS